MTIDNLSLNPAKIQIELNPFIPGKGARPVVHDAVLPRDPVAGGLKIVRVGDGRVEERGVEAAVAELLHAGDGPVDHGLHHVHGDGAVVDVGGDLPAVDVGRGLVVVADVGDVAAVGEELAVDVEGREGTAAVDVDDDVLRLPRVGVRELVVHARLEVERRVADGPRVARVFALAVEFLKYHDFNKNSRTCLSPGLTSEFCLHTPPCSHGLGEHLSTA